MSAKTPYVSNTKGVNFVTNSRSNIISRANAMSINHSAAADRTQLNAELNRSSDDRTSLLLTEANLAVHNEQKHGHTSMQGGTADNTSTMGNDVPHNPVMQAWLAGSDDHMSYWIGHGSQQIKR
ncbi:hypothetical protein LTR36_008126 [Oleoguttula mirabilis]|uniref:Uncharacterized protein n=1 Tax=Oleoguttula mirabilis TaxID=1507867 RepID=A0AAV9J9E9_9PEZI|nr:hypothetical protein LTR36_008126 [Oleoguttula mirabilis]